MKLGNRIIFLFIFVISLNFCVTAEDRIISTPLINLKDLKPSFEEEGEIKKNNIVNQETKKELKIKKKII